VCVISTIQKKYNKGKKGGSRFTSITKVSFTQNFKKVRQLLLFKKSQSGRNNTGQITVAHQGSGVKVGYRLVDNKREIVSKLQVLRLESVPRSTRTAFLALVLYPFSVLSYVIASHGIGIGSIIHNHGYIPVGQSNASSTVLETGSSVSISAMQPGLSIHNVELLPGRGGVLARAAGTFCTIRFINNDLGVALLKLPSDGYVKVSINCRAVVGRVSNIFHKNNIIGKAGRNRRAGIRPTVRGVTKNAVDHPHGGGEARSSSGRPSVTPWGRITKGQPTAKKQRMLALKRLKMFKEYIQ
jgi:large subunit ribosomal protein L2